MDDVQRRKHYLLIYDLVDDYVERRSAFREEHLRLARESHERGELVVGGAVADPADQAILLFEAESADIVGAFAHRDPYVANGLVKQWRVREWTTVVGVMALTPL